MFATVFETVGLAEWIIDDTCLVKFSSAKQSKVEIVIATGQRDP